MKHKLTNLISLLLTIAFLHTPAVCMGRDGSLLRPQPYEEAKMQNPLTSQREGYTREEEAKAFNTEKRKAILSMAIREIEIAFPDSEFLPDINMRRKVGHFSTIYTGRRRAPSGEFPLVFEVPQSAEPGIMEATRNNAANFSHYYKAGMRRFLPKPFCFVEVEFPNLGEPLIVPVSAHERFIGYYELNFRNGALCRWILTADQNYPERLSPEMTGNILSETCAVLTYHYEPNINGGTSIAAVDVNAGDFIIRDAEHAIKPDGSPDIKLITARKRTSGIGKSLFIWSLINLDTTEHLVHDSGLFTESPGNFSTLPVSLSNMKIAFEGLIRGLIYLHKERGEPDAEAKGFDEALVWIKEFRDSDLGRPMKKKIEEWLSTVTAATKIRSRVNIVPFGGAMSLEGQPQAEELRRDIAALREVVNDRLQQGIPPRDETVANIGYAQSRLEDINRMVLNSVLRPQAYKDAGSVKARGTKKTRQARCELAEQYIANPVVAWNRWEEFINERNTAPVYYGTTKNKGALIENRLVDNYKRGIECLSHGQWEDAYDLAISSVTLMHENAYRYSPVTIENIRRLFLWSYHINFRRMIGGHIFRLLDRYAQTDSERLAIVDLNFLLWYDEASFTEAEWYRQIAFWHELFQDGIVYRPAILREKIRKWLLDLDRPKKVIIDDRTQTVRFTMDPYDYTPYIYAAFNDIFDIPPARQPFEDANHRVGCILLNYLLMKHTGGCDLQIFGPGHNYGKGPERRIVVIHGIQDGGNSNMIEDQLQQAIKEVLALQQV